jgi:hypothetical protein
MKAMLNHTAPHNPFLQHQLQMMSLVWSLGVLYEEKCTEQPLRVCAATSDSTQTTLTSLKFPQVVTMAILTGITLPAYN